MAGTETPLCMMHVFNAYPDAIYIWNNDDKTPLGVAKTYRFEFRVRVPNHDDDNSLGVAAAYRLDEILAFFDTQLRCVQEGQDDRA